MIRKSFLTLIVLQVFMARAAQPDTEVHYKTIREKAANIMKGSLATYLCAKSAFAIKDALLASEPQGGPANEPDRVSRGLKAAVLSYSAAHLASYAKESFQQKSPSLFAQPQEQVEPLAQSLVKAGASAVLAAIAAQELKSKFDKKFIVFKQVHVNGDETLFRNYEPKYEKRFVRSERYHELPKASELPEMLNLAYAGANGLKYSYEKLKPHSEDVKKLLKGTLAALVCLDTAPRAIHSIKEALQAEQLLYGCIIGLQGAALALSISKLAPYARKSLQLQSVELFEKKEVTKDQSRLVSFTKGTLAGIAALITAWAAKNRINPLSPSESLWIFNLNKHVVYDLKSDPEVEAIKVGTRYEPVYPPINLFGETLGLAHAAYISAQYSYEKLKQAFDEK